ncbi:2-C-methyl-D-erythritol 4-phosphate cytidylyltransferase [Thalassotalea sp. 42_200_T64]|nr:2-C-methyl-D-erythritol 4-phosphate cytidylyltransferase [Thalassotalea sp. 42_200_T64]
MNNQRFVKPNVSNTYSVVVPAAGIGKRMSKNIAKQYLKISGKCIIEHTLERLLSHPKINRIVVALAEHDQYFRRLAIANNPQINTVIGGGERSDSVLAGLKALTNDFANDRTDEENNTSHNWVLVHDAARPCVTHADIDALIEFCQSNCSGNDSAGAILATPVRDTMKRCSSSQQISHTEERENLWHAQTPQMFKLTQLTQALTQGLRDNAPITDEASAMEHVGINSFVVSGREDNIKITRPSDLNLAAFILTQQKEEACV